MKKILIVGAGIEQIPAIKIAKEMGFRVLTNDMNPHAPGFQYADKSFVISTLDYEATLKIADEEQIDGITTVCSETAIPTIAKVAATLDLPGLSEFTALAATNKKVMREEVGKLGVMAPRNVSVSSLQELQQFAQAVGGLMVVKPSDSSGQRGMTFTDDLSILQQAFEKALPFSRDGRVVAEEYIPGPEINVTAVVRHGEVHFLSLSHRITEADLSFGVAIRHLGPADISQEDEQAIKKMSVKAIRAIGLKNGIAYPQIILSPLGPRFIEIAARMPGGNMRDVALHLSGVDMVRAQILIALNEEFSLDDIRETAYPAVAVRFITSLDYPDTHSKIKAVEGVEEAQGLEGVKRAYVLLKPGETVPPLENGIARFGGAIAVGDSREEAMINATRACETIKLIF